MIPANRGAAIYPPLLGLFKKIVFLKETFGNFVARPSAFVSLQLPNTMER